MPPSRFFEELDFQSTSMGDLSLRRRRFPQLGDLDIYEVKLGEEFLMSSLFHDVEEALATLPLRNLSASLDVVVGGLGLGYTAAAALRFETVRSLLVIDALKPVIDWHQQGLVPLGKILSSDPRCQMQLGDFFALASDPATGFDPNHPGRRYHAVLLDVDHSPDKLLHPRHASFYEPTGLKLLSNHLHPGGVFGLWSDDPPDEKFLEHLRTVFGRVEASVVKFENPLRGNESASTVYLAWKDPASGA